MTNEERPLEQLAQVIRDDLGTGASAERLRRQRQGLVALAKNGPPAAPPHRLRVMAAVAAVVLVGVVVWVLWPGGQPLSYTVGEAVMFEDGSRLDVEPGTAVDVVSASRRQVDVALEQGSVRASIEGNGVTRWVLHAGVFQVVVVGTMFTAEWDGAQTVLDVWVEEGVVRVGAEGLPEFKEQEVAAGRHLQANGRSGAVMLEPWSPPDAPEAFTDADPRAAAMPPVVTVDGAVAAMDPVAPSSSGLSGSGRTSTPRVATPSTRATVKEARWVRLYHNRQCTEAIDAAELLGLEGLLSDSTQGELWQLTDAARCAGRSELAVQALRSYRDRFGDTNEARIAAYLLGRTALEQLDDPASAVAWFQTYLDEAPDGPLAEEALGRLMLASGEAGLHDRAGEAAQRYLVRFPDGSFASLARTINEG